MDEKEGLFPITSVHRVDIKEALKLTDAQVARITDDMMRQIARKMADDYCEQLFWDHLPIIVEHIAEREGIDLSERPSGERRMEPVETSRSVSTKNGARR
jgi:hypothetical protein